MSDAYLDDEVAMQQELCEQEERQEREDRLEDMAEDY